MKLLSDTALAYDFILRIADQFDLEVGEFFLGNAKGRNPSDFAEHVNQRESVEHAAVRCNDEVSLATIDPFKKRKCASATTALVGQNTDIPSAITNKRHFRSIQIGDDNLSRHARGLHHAMFINDFNDQPIGRYVHSASGTFMSNEPTVTTSITIGDATAEAVLNPGSPFVMQILGSDKHALDSKSAQVPLLTIGMFTQKDD